MPYNFTGAVVCSDGLSLPSETRSLDYTVLYSEPYTPSLPEPLKSYTVDDWTDYKTLKEIDTGLAALSVDLARAGKRFHYTVSQPLPLVYIAGARNVGNFYQ